VILLRDAAVILLRALPFTKLLAHAGAFDANDLAGIGAALARLEDVVGALTPADFPPAARRSEDLAVVAPAHDTGPCFFAAASRMSAPAASR